MSNLFLVRLALDFTAAALLLIALAYYGFNNAVHEVVGTAMFLLLIAHNIFNRYWWSGLAKQRREPRNIITTAMNLSLLATILMLLVTSVTISQTMFSFLPIKSSSISRQIHAAAAYWALVIVGFHLGWHWHMISAAVSTRLGVAKLGTLRTTALRVIAIGLATFGVHSAMQVDIGSKLFMQMRLNSWNISASTPALFAHHITIVCLLAFLAHYTMAFFRSRKRKMHFSLAHETAGRSER